MNKIEYALKLAKDCTYADEMMESAKEYLRNEIDEALKIVLPQANVIKSVCLHDWQFKFDETGERRYCHKCNKLI